MNQATNAAYVDRAGNPPADTVAGRIPSSDPAQLAAILRALGLDVSAAAGDSPSPAFTAAATDVRWTVLPRGETPVRRKERHYFLSDEVATAFDAAVAAGATVVLRPQRTSFGLRFTIADADRRQFVVTQRGTETAGMPPPADESATEERFDETPPDRAERRSLKIQRTGIGACLLGTMLVTAAALFQFYLALFHHRRAPNLAVHAWSTTIPHIWMYGLIFLFVGRVALLVDPGRTGGFGLLVWVLVLDVVNFLCWLMLLGHMDAYWAGLFFHYLSAIVFARYLATAAADFRSPKAARAAEWANSGFMLALLLWMAEPFVFEVLIRRGNWWQKIEISLAVAFLATHALQMMALGMFARYSANRLFRTVELEPAADDSITDSNSLP